MTVTEADIQAFSEFARRQAINGGANITMGELAAKWEAVRERATANCAIRDSLSDIEAGRTEAFFESQDDFRQMPNEFQFLRIGFEYSITWPRRN